MIGGLNLCFFWKKTWKSTWNHPNLVINPPTNWELILQALMLPFPSIVRNIDWQNSDAENWQIRGVAFFLMLPARVSCKKKMGQQFYPKNTVCVSQESSPNFSVWNSPTRSVLNYKWGYTLYKWPNPTSKCMPIYNQFFVAHLVLYPCFARQFGLQDSVEWPKSCCRKNSEARGGSAVLLQVLGNSQYQDRGFGFRNIWKYATTWNPNDLYFRRFFCPKTRPL